jgi:predicted glycoside hydrolase/deacetylase ChbG (UPF0249 family)
MKHEGLKKAMKQLIVNADDLGLSPGVNEGIVQAIESGCVRSTTALAGAPAFTEGIEKAAGLDGVGIGIHLNLTGPWNAPPKKIPAGFFRGTPGPLLTACLTARIDLGFAERCLREQIESFLRTGIKPTHLDGHHHIHLFPGIAPLAARLGSEYGIPFVRLPRGLLSGYRACRGDLFKRLLIHFLARRGASHYRARSIRSLDRFIGFGLMGRTDYRNRFHKILDVIEEGTTEIMVHPGMAGDNLILDSYVKGRTVETAALTASETLERIARLGIRLISYGDLA